MPSMQERLEILQSTLQQLQSRRLDLARTASKQDDAKVTSDSEIVDQALQKANSITQQHIHVLTTYNEIKDVAVSLIGMIADNKQKRIIEVMHDFGVEDHD